MMVLLIILLLGMGYAILSFRGRQIFDMGCNRFQVHRYYGFSHYFESRIAKLLKIDSEVLQHKIALLTAGSEITTAEVHLQMIMKSRALFGEDVDTKIENAINVIKVKYNYVVEQRNREVMPLRLDYLEIIGSNNELSGRFGESFEKYFNAYRFVIEGRTESFKCCHYAKQLQRKVSCPLS